MLDKEFETFEKAKVNLQKKYSDGFVVIKGTKVIGVYHSRVDALTIGINKWGNVPFLIRNIYEESIPAPCIYFFGQGEVLSY